MNNSSKTGILLEAGTNEVEFLLFNLGTQTFAINVGKICQVMLHNNNYTLVPGQRAELIGVFDFRGKTATIIDLRTHLNLTHLENLANPDRRMLIVTEFNQRVSGFIVDSVDRIVRCNWKQFESTDETTCDPSSVVGLLRIKEGLIPVLDLEAILAAIDPSMSFDHYQREIQPPTTDRSEVSIVYCEDSELIQKVFLQTIETAGFTDIKVFPNGADGLEYLKNCKPDSVDVIVSDIEMPKMDGLTLCKETRSLNGFQTKPFIFFSSMIDEKMKRKCESVGGTNAITKPEIHKMIEFLEASVKAKRALRPS